MTILATSQFVKQYCDDAGRFLTQSGRSKLAELWNLEKALLASMPNYNLLLNERHLGEIHPTEACDVAYDNLGHSCLCAINLFPAWKSYALEHRRPEIEAIAALGSWQARKWLKLEITADLPPLDDGAIARRIASSRYWVFSRALTAGSKKTVG